MDKREIFRITELKSNLSFKVNGESRNSRKLEEIEGKIRGMTKKIPGITYSVKSWFFENLGIQKTSNKLVLLK